MKGALARGSTRRIALLIGFLLALVSGHCGGGGEDKDPVCTTPLFFDGALTSPGPGDVFLLHTGSTCTTVSVSVLVNDLSGIFTVGFDLTYPSSILQYGSYVVGPLLTRGTTNPPLVVVTAGSGLIQVAMSRQAGDSSVTAGSNGILISFQFSKASAGAGAIDFISSPSSLVTEEVLDENGNVQPASFGPAHGGMVTVP